VGILNPTRAILAIDNYRFNLFIKCSRARFDLKALQGAKLSTPALLQGIPIDRSSAAPKNDGGGDGDVARDDDDGDGANDDGDDDGDVANGGDGGGDDGGGIARAAFLPTAPATARHHRP
jgi:hypothetical protein